MSNFDELLEASKSSDEVYKFLSAYISTKTSSVKKDEKLTNHALIELDKYDEFVAMLHGSGNSWPLEEYNKLIHLSIKLERPEFYRLLRRESYKCFVKDVRSFLRAASDTLTELEFALDHKCNLSFYETILDAAKPFLDDTRTCVWVLRNCSIHAVKNGRLDVLKLLYKKYKWNCSTTFCDTLRQATQNNQIDIVKWIVETSSPITSANGYHFCPITIFREATCCSDTQILEWLMNKCNYLPFADYFVDPESPFFDNEVRAKVQALIAEGILSDLLGDSTRPARQLLEKYIEVYEKPKKTTEPAE